ncbi:MAG: hypothetical protein QF415_09795 [Candidatus Undinarchaeales archaeon]|nr:hypothetical protein [Candidatus Undinarchaeales archaeon]MDP7492448.1 hypothetical protein [Candidatus Undinarchaeales archaeon]
MVCCGGTEGREPVSYVGFLLALVVTAAFNLVFVPVLVLTAIVLPRYRAPAHFYLSYLTDTAPALLAEPDVSPRARCRLVGRILRHSPGVGGIVYRNFAPLCAVSGVVVMLALVLVVIGAIGQLPIA